MSTIYNHEITHTFAELDKFIDVFDSNYSSRIIHHFKETSAQVSTTTADVKYFAAFFEIIFEISRIKCKSQ